MATVALVPEPDLITVTDGPAFIRLVISLDLMENVNLARILTDGPATLRLELP